LAEHGNTGAQVMMGAIYAKGQGVRQDICRGA
jgi:TPR repeat protein